MKNEEIIILLLIALVLYLIYNKQNYENFNITENSDNNKNISEYWKLRGYKVSTVPNFLKAFGLKDLSKNLEFAKEQKDNKENWKLFTDTDLIKNEGLASLLSVDKLDEIRMYDYSEENIRVTGFKKPSAVIGIMTPTRIVPSGQWLKSFIWIGSSRWMENTNAKKVILWANHKDNIDIKLNKDGLIDDAIKIFEFEVGQKETLLTSKEYFIDNYKSKNYPPYTTYYFQIINNWGNPYTVKVGGLILNYEI
jgi:hypothetical protein